MKAIYWTCRKCNNIGVVYPGEHEDVYDQIRMIEGDHLDAIEDEGCELDLAQLTMSKVPNARHRRAVREAEHA